MPDTPSPTDHLAEAKRAPMAPEASAHALIAIAESLRGQARDESRCLAEQLRDGEHLADGSVVVRIEEPFEFPEVVYVSVARGHDVTKLVLLRSTVVAVK